MRNRILGAGNNRRLQQNLFSREGFSERNVQRFIHVKAEFANKKKMKPIVHRNSNCCIASKLANGVPFFKFLSLRALKFQATPSLINNQTKRRPRIRLFLLIAKTANENIRLLPVSTFRCVRCCCSTTIANKPLWISVCRIGYETEKTLAVVKPGCTKTCRNQQQEQRKEVHNHQSPLLRQPTCVLVQALLT